MAYGKKKDALAWRKVYAKENELKRKKFQKVKTSSWEISLHSA